MTFLYNPSDVRSLIGFLCLYMADNHYHRIYTYKPTLLPVGHNPSLHLRLVLLHGDSVNGLFVRMGYRFVAYEAHPVSSQKSDFGFALHLESCLCMSNPNVVTFVPYMEQLVSKEHRYVFEAHHFHIYN